MDVVDGRKGRVQPTAWLNNQRDRGSRQHGRWGRRHARFNLYVLCTHRAHLTLYWCPVPGSASYHEIRLFLYSTIYWAPGRGAACLLCLGQLGRPTAVGCRSHEAIRRQVPPYLAAVPSTAPPLRYPPGAPYRFRMTWTFLVLFPAVVVQAPFGLLRSFLCVIPYLALVLPTAMLRPRRRSSAHRDHYTPKTATHTRPGYSLRGTRETEVLHWLRKRQSRVHLPRWFGIVVHSSLHSPWQRGRDALRIGGRIASGSRRGT